MPASRTQGPSGILSGTECVGLSFGVSAFRIRRAVRVISWRLARHATRCTVNAIAPRFIETEMTMPTAGAHSAPSPGRAVDSRVVRPGHMSPRSAPRRID